MNGRNDKAAGRGRMPDRVVKTCASDFLSFPPPPTWPRRATLRPGSVQSDRLSSQESKLNPLLGKEPK